MRAVSNPNGIAITVTTPMRIKDIGIVKALSEIPLPLVTIILLLDGKF
jgi:hypothetical protein